MKKHVLIFTSLGLLFSMGLTAHQANAEEFQNVAETSLRTDINDHITGLRAPDDKQMKGSPSLHDKIQVDKISQKKEADGSYTLTIDGFMTAADEHHHMSVSLEKANGALIQTYEYELGNEDHHKTPIGSLSTMTEVERVSIHVSNHSGGHSITAVYDLRDDEKPAHAAPTISGADNKEIDLNSHFDPMEGVTASDWNNVDLTSQISVTGTVVTSVPGEYTLVYSVTDSEGKTTTVYRVITVKEGEKEIPAPTINEPVTDQDTSITGRGDTPGNTITVTNQAGAVLGTGTVQADGSFIVNIPAQDKYTILSVTETDGTKTSPATNVVVREGTPVQQDKITGLDTYSITHSSYWVTGAYEGLNVARVRLIVDDNILPSVPVENGEIRYYAASAITSPTQTVQVQILDASEKVLDTKTLTVTA